MTSDRLEFLLAIGIVIVYLLDAMRFLGHRQALVERLAPDRWLLHFGAVRFELMGRRPVLPNPLRPGRASWVVNWQLQDACGAAVPPPDWMTVGRSHALLGWLCLASLWTVVILAPILLVAGLQLWFAAAIGAGYLLAMVAAVVLVLRAGDLGLTRRAALEPAVIAVLCLPCAPNLLRASAVRCVPSIALPGFAEASGGGREQRSFRRGFARVLRHELLLGHGDEHEDDRLQQALRRLEEGS